MSRTNCPPVALDQKVWEERLRREMRIVAGQPSPQQIQAGALASDLQLLREMRGRLSQHTNGYKWSIEREEPVLPPRYQGLNALAGLSKGIPTAETDFMSHRRSAPRHWALTLQKPTMPPARYPDFEPSGLTDEEYRLFLGTCQPLRPPQRIPEPPPVPAHTPARLAENGFKGTANAEQWLRGESALSQWDSMARSARVMEMELAARKEGVELAQAAFARLSKFEMRRTKKKVKPQEPVEGSRPADPLRVPR